MKVNSPDATKLSVTAGCIRLTLSHLDITEENLSNHIGHKFSINTAWTDQYVRKIIRHDPDICRVVSKRTLRYVIFNDYAVEVLAMDAL